MNAWLAIIWTLLVCNYAIQVCINPKAGPILFTVGPNISYKNELQESNEPELKNDWHWTIYSFLCTWEGVEILKKTRSWLNQTDFLLRAPSRLPARPKTIQSPFPVPDVIKSNHPNHSTQILLLQSVSPLSFVMIK